MPPVQMLNASNKTKRFFTLNESKYAKNFTLTNSLFQMVNTCADAKIPKLNTDSLEAGLSTKFSVYTQVDHLDAGKTSQDIRPKSTQSSAILSNECWITTR
jgi:hypothetical protein